MSDIVPEKYKGKYKTPDWIGTFVNDQATEPVMKTVKVKDDDGNVTEEKKPSARRVLNLDNFFELCRANRIDTSKMEEQRDRKNAPGRIRMTLGNSLRAAARKRGGLFGRDGEWNEAPESFTQGVEPVETREGEKIKPSKEAEAA